MMILKENKTKQNKTNQPNKKPPKAQTTNHNGTCTFDLGCAGDLELEILFRDKDYLFID